MIRPEGDRGLLMGEVYVVAYRSGAVGDRSVQDEKKKEGKSRKKR